MTATGLGSLRPNQSLKARVFESLRTAIVSGRLVPGTLYSVETVSKDLGVSRTPVREALLDLAARGMVGFERSQGFRVLQMSIDDLKELLTLRLLAEPAAAYHAAGNMQPEEAGSLTEMAEHMLALSRSGQSTDVLELDRTFHRRIMLAAGNRRLADHVDQLRDLMTLRGYYTDAAQQDLSEHLEQHLTIMVTIRNADPAAAAAAMHEHIVDTGRDLLRHAGDPDGMVPWHEGITYA